MISGINILYEIPVTKLHNAILWPDVSVPFAYANEQHGEASARRLPAREMSKCCDGVEAKNLELLKGWEAHVFSTLFLGLDLK